MFYLRKKKVQKEFHSFINSNNFSIECSFNFVNVVRPKTHLANWWQIEYRLLAPKFDRPTIYKKNNHSILKFFYYFKFYDIQTQSRFRSMKQTWNTVFESGCQTYPKSWRATCQWKNTNFDGKHFFK